MSKDARRALVPHAATWASAGPETRARSMQARMTLAQRIEPSIYFQNQRITDCIHCPQSLCLEQHSTQVLYCSLCSVQRQANRHRSLRHETEASSAQAQNTWQERVDAQCQRVGYCLSKPMFPDLLDTTRTSGDLDITTECKVDEMLRERLQQSQGEQNTVICPGVLSTSRPSQTIPVILKVFDVADEEARQDACAEIMITYALSRYYTLQGSPFHPQMYACFEQRSEMRLVMVMEHLIGTVSELVQKDTTWLRTDPDLFWDRFGSMLAQVCLGLALAKHVFALCHNDTHPDNIMYRNVSERYALGYKFVSSKSKTADAVIDARQQQQQQPAARFTVPTFGKQFVLIDYGRAAHCTDSLSFVSGRYTYFTRDNKAQPDYRQETADLQCFVLCLLERAHRVGMTWPEPRDEYQRRVQQWWHHIRSNCCQGRRVNTGRMVNLFEEMRDRMGRCTSRESRLRLAHKFCWHIPYSHASTGYQGITTKGLSALSAVELMTLYRVYSYDKQIPQEKFKVNVQTTPVLPFHPNK